MPPWPFYETPPWAATVGQVSPLKLDLVFDDRYFMASNELNLLNTLLLAKQDKGDTQTRPHLKGSWAPAGDVHAGAGGRIMITSLSILSLEVYYRHLPLYRRDMGNKTMVAQ